MFILLLSFNNIIINLLLLLSISHIHSLTSILNIISRTKIKLRNKILIIFSNNKFFDLLFFLKCFSYLKFF